MLGSYSKPVRPQELETREGARRAAVLLQG